jgi:hypothetical protein
MSPSCLGSETKTSKKPASLLLPPAGTFLDLYFFLEDGGDMFLRNGIRPSTDYTASRPSVITPSLLSHGVLMTLAEQTVDATGF